MSNKYDDRLDELVARSGKLSKEEYFEACQALRERIRKEHKGELMPDSVDIIRSMRDDDPNGFYYRG